MAQSGWKQWSAEDAGRELKALQTSGEPLEVFARRRGYSGERLRRWGARLNATPLLLPVRVVGSDAISRKEPPPVELVLRGGRTLRVACGFDQGHLVELVRVLESIPC